MPAPPDESDPAIVRAIDGGVGVLLSDTTRDLQFKVLSLTRFHIWMSDISVVPPMVDANNGSLRQLRLIDGFIHSRQNTRSNHVRKRADQLVDVGNNAICAKGFGGPVGVAVIHNDDRTASVSRGGYIVVAVTHHDDIFN